jgi:hypothetical protein
MKNLFTIFPSNQKVTMNKAKLLSASISKFAGGRGSLILVPSEEVGVWEQLVEDNKVKIYGLSNPTKGALITVAVGIDQVPKDSEILIAPTNALIHADLQNFINELRENNADAGVIAFTSNNPNYSYLRTFQNEIIEVSEKIVSGTLATAGIFYFRNRDLLISSIKWAIVNNVSHKGDFYIAPSLNYFVMNNLRIRSYLIEESEYIRHEN